MRDWKLGLIVRCDNGGLGIESVEFFNGLRPDKLLVVHAGYENHPERFAGSAWQLHVGLQPSEEEVCEFLDGLDAMLTVETPYSWRLFKIARVHGVRTVMKVNYEWLEDHDRPDCYVLPNRWHVEDCPGTEGVDKFVLGLPVDLRRFRFRQRTQAATFLHVVGHAAGHDRNGTQLVVEALRHSKADYRLVIASQLPRHRCVPLTNDPRVEVRDVDVDDNASLYRDADVLVMPRRYGGQSLVMDEAAACGMPMIASYMQPQVELFQHSSIFLPLADVGTVMVKREVEYGRVDPSGLGYVMDELATLKPPASISLLSDRAPLAVYERSFAAWEKVLAPR